MLFVRFAKSMEVAWAVKVTEQSFPRSGGQTYLTTFVASVTMESGIVTLIARAVWRLAMSSNLLGTPIGRSPG